MNYVDIKYVGPYHICIYYLHNMTFGNQELSYLWCHNRIDKDRF